jgi:hypothetical protein
VLFFKLNPNNYSQLIGSVFNMDSYVTNLAWLSTWTLVRVFFKLNPNNQLVGSVFNMDSPYVTNFSMVQSDYLFACT